MSLSPFSLLELSNDMFNSYYQPNPPAPAPFTVVPALNDPKFDNCAGQSASCYDSWGLRILNSQNVLIYGAGHYSFFNNNNGCEYISFS